MRKVRITLALLLILLMTVLCVDFSGVCAPYLGWLAKIQFWPAVLAGSVVTVLILALVTLCFGRVYCSVICPLGILQDIAFWLRRKLGREPVFAYMPPHRRIRLGVLAAFLAGGFLPLHYTLLEPYAIYTRAAGTFGGMAVRWGNNLLAAYTAKTFSYAVVAVENVLPCVAMLVLAGVMIVAVLFFAVARGRLWCNVICPIGTILGMLSRFARMRVRLDKARCVSCGMCVRQCKGQCIDISKGEIDTTRCVVCFDCTATCRKGALTWK